MATTGGSIDQPGDLQGGDNEDQWYTRSFYGTYSAAAMVAGALGCVQGVLRAHGRALLTPARAREELRATGSPQQDAPDRPASQRIGNRPDLRQLIPRVLETVSPSGVKFTGTWRPTRRSPGPPRAGQRTGTWCGRWCRPLPSPGHPRSAGR